MIPPGAVYASGKDLENRRSLLKKQSTLRHLAGLLVLLLLLPALAGSSPIQAKNDLVYLFINDTLIKSMTSSNMPIRINNSMYISYRYLVRIKPIKYFYDEDMRILKVYTADSSLIFDVGNSITYDQDGKIYSYLAEIRGGVLYVPIEFICRIFGAVYSQYSSEYGPVIRINSIMSSYSDTELTAANREAMKALYDEYYPAAEQTAPVQPDPPDVTPEPDPSPDESGPVRRRTVYPMICGPINANTQTILSALETYGWQASFFLSEEDLTVQGDLLRRIVCGGHSLGLYVSAADPVAQADALNELLSSMVLRKSRLVCIREGSRALSAAQKQALHDAGYRIWDGSLDPGSAAKSGDTVAANGRNLLQNAGSTSSLLLCSTEGSRGAVYSLLHYMRDNSFTVAPIDDWTTPINAIQYYG